VVLAENLADPSNLGALVRNAAALGASLVVASARGADPFSRRAIRASAGHVLDHPVIVSPDPLATVATFVESLPGLRTFAATLSPTATPLAQLRWDGPSMLMFGNEGQGLSSSLTAAAHEQVRIEMAPGVDSLNVAAASAVMLWAHRMVASRS
jgi:tRNA G18 (ribose-2'-O)-methylase SpoU